jgi:hypothetical protein
MVEKRTLCPQKLNTHSPATYTKAYREGTLIKKNCVKVNIKGKGKVHPRKGHDSPV